MERRSLDLAVQLTKPASYRVIGVMEVAVPAWMRHELQIQRSESGSPSMPALVSRINPAGSLAKISLQAEGGTDIQVDMPFERFLELDLKVGEQVYVAPKRVRVFSPDDYVI